MTTWMTPTLASALDTPDAAQYLLTSPTPDAASAPTDALAPVTALAPAPSLAPAVESPAIANPLVRCGCGRRTNADMLTDIRALSADTLTAIGHAGDDFICDGCRSRVFREQRITPVAFYQALGAPQSVLDLLTSAAS